MYRNGPLSYIIFMRGSKIPQRWTFRPWSCGLWKRAVM